MNRLRTATLLGGMVLIIGVQAIDNPATAEGTVAPSTTTDKIVDVVLQSGNPGQTLQTGYTTMETATVSCKFSSCTLGMNIMANIGESTCTQEEWKIVGLVDGNSVDGGPDVGSVPGAGQYQSRSWQGAYSVDSGKHTIAFQIYAPCDVTAYQWAVSYFVTTP
jgi:hypothetical protein